jgi:hypothetical protein
MSFHKCRLLIDFDRTWEDEKDFFQDEGKDRLHFGLTMRQCQIYRLPTDLDYARDEGKAFFPE